MFLHHNMLPLTLMMLVLQNDQEIIIFNRNTCATIIGTPTFNTLYNSTEFSPITWYKVGQSI